MAAPTIADLAVLPDLEKLAVVDWELARALEEASWTATGAGSYYLAFTDGEVVRVQIDGVELAERFSVATCDAIASTFYYDIANQRLYVHTPDGDSPAAAGPKYSVVAFFFEGFANRPVVMARYREVLTDGRLDRWNSSTDPECWTDTIVGTAAVARDTATVYDRYSAYSAKLTVSAISSSIALTQNAVLRLSCNALLRLKFKGTGVLHLQLYDSASNVWLDSSGVWQATAQTINAGTGSSSWAEFSLAFLAHASYRLYVLRIFADTNADSLYVDNVELKRYYTKDFFAPYLPAGSIPNVRHSIGTLHEPEEQLSFGTVNFIDDGWFAGKLSTYLWANKKFYLKIGQLALGEINAEYDDLAPLFTGLSRQPTLARAGFSVEVKDVRAELAKIPITTFDSTTYPNCETAWANKAVPITLGHIHNITPPCSNTSTYTYRVSEVTFRGVSYSLTAVDAVYKDGVLQTLTTHYTVNLSAGTFTMVSNPGSAVITCDVRGIAMGWPSASADYAYPAGWIKFLMVDLNAISKEEIGWASLLGVANTRGIQQLGHWFGDYDDSYNVLNMIKFGAMIQVYTRPNGEICFNTITSTVPSDAPRFVNEDYLAPLEIIQDVDQCYLKTIIKHAEDPTDGTWKEQPGYPEASRANWQHGVSRIMTLETYIDLGVQAAFVADYYTEILKEPPTIIRTTLPAQALLLNPTDKIYINYSMLDADGNEVSIFSDQVFIILDIEKNENDGTAAITAIKYTAAMAWTMS